MARTFTYSVVIECGSNGSADMNRVQEMVALTMQDLIYDDDFVSALGETQSVSVQVTPILDN
jgi:hypothetical protein